MLLGICVIAFLNILERVRIMVHSIPFLRFVPTFLLSFGKLMNMLLPNLPNRGCALRKLASLCRKLSRIPPFDTWFVVKQYPFGRKRYTVYCLGQGSSSIEEVRSFLTIKDVSDFLLEQFR